MKHAYLVSAFDNQPQLEKLLSLLDDERNDIYLQIDSKGTLRPETLRTRKAGLHLLPPRRIYWGGSSFIQAILALLRAATPGKYHYYHLITGGDLPLVSQDTIHAFLAGADREYIDFAPEYDAFCKFKAAYYHIFVETRWFRTFRPLRALGHGLVKLQALLGVDRGRRNKEAYHHGSTYFSITHDFATYILEQEPWITRTFRCTLACDEVFLQTLVRKSPFNARLHDPADGMTGNLRYIDWKRRNKNSPYTFRSTDFDELAAAGAKAFFARKFDARVDPEIVDRMVRSLEPRV